MYQLGTPISLLLNYLKLSHCPLSSFHIFRFSFLCVSFWMVSITLSSTSITFFLLPCLIFHYSHPIYFSSHIFKFSFLQVQYGPFLILSSLLVNFLNMWNAVILNVFSIFVCSSIMCVSPGSISMDWFFSSWILFSCCFLCLVTLDWMPDIVNFMLLDARYFAFLKIFLGFVLECGYIASKLFDPFVCCC